MTQVQIRIPEQLAKTLDKWISEGRFNTRSQAIRTIITLYEEREKTREFLQMLQTREKEAETKTEILKPLSDIQ